MIKLRNFTLTSFIVIFSISLAHGFKYTSNLNKRDTSKLISSKIRKPYPKLASAKITAAKGVSITTANKSSLNTAGKFSRHTKKLVVYQVNALSSILNYPLDSLNYVVLEDLSTGEKVNVYVLNDNPNPVVASLNSPERYIDIISPAPCSSYQITAASGNSYKVNLFKNIEFISIKTIDNNIGTMSMSGFSTAIDTMKAPVRERIPDSLRARVLIIKLKERINALGMDSLKLIVKKYSNDTLKAAIFSEIATRYMDYDTINNKRKRLSYQNNAVTYSTLAMQQYYKGSDSLGMRASFDNMAKVYYAQKKFSQAKWFILQSNSLSRGKNDIPNVITSLITLSAIKSEINDYTLAMKDLNEAMSLSEKYNYPKFELLVLKNYALLYSRMKNYPKEELVLKKRDSLEAQIQKKEQDSLLAKVAISDSLQTKKIDSVQIKKKVYTSNTRKLSKNSSVKKIASL